MRAILTAILLLASSSIAAHAATVIIPTLGQKIFHNSSRELKVLLHFSSDAEIGSANSTADSPETKLRRNSALSQSDARRRLGSALSQKAESFWIANVMFVTLPANQLTELLKSKNLISAEIPSIVSLVDSPSAGREVPSGPSYGLQKMRIPELHALRPDINGKSVKVGILDTGIDPSHPDLSGKTVLFRDFISGSKTPYDNNYHGTHVAGIIAGSANANFAIGVAPGVQLVVGKAFDKDGISSSEKILRAMQWIADPDGDPATDDAPRIVSNSWSSGAASGDSSTNVQCEAVANWVKLGIVPVFAAGNRGPIENSVGVPGACPEAISVAATDPLDAIAPFSSRGLANWSNGSIFKPDISAPGVDVYSAMPGGTYGFSSGTSMAAPYVAGLAALLLQENPAFLPQRSKEALTNSALDLGEPGPDPAFGHGRADALSLFYPNINQPQFSVR